MPPTMGSLPSREGDAPQGGEATSPIWTYLRETTVDPLHKGRVSDRVGDSEYT
jgi:hypothetical protein